MIFLISPSKTMNIKALDHTKPSRVLTSARTVSSLRNALQKLDQETLKNLYKTSDKVVELAQSLNRDKRVASSMALFEGLVFKNIEYATLLDKERAFIDDHLLILSALYGVVSPAQLITPYRLDLNNSLEGAIENLTEVWRKRVTDYLIHNEEKCVINLASEEYTKLIDISRLRKKKCFINIEFLEQRDDKLVTVATYAKMARGKYMRAVAKVKPVDREALKNIVAMDYMFSSHHSTDENFVYIR